VRWKYTAVQVFLLWGARSVGELGPVTTLLEEQIKAELRSHGIVVWLDKDNHYSQYVDTLIDRYNGGDFFAPVVAFRGSYLRMVLAMENCCNGLDRERLLIHMPGHTEESIRKTPMLEVYLAGIRFRKKLDTLIQEAANGLIGPKEIEAFLKSGAVTLEGAEEMLNSQRNAQRGGLAHHLDGLTLEWVLDGMLGKKALQSRIVDRAAVETLLDYLYRHAGMDASFLNFFLGQEKYTFNSVSDAFAGWLMCVEYVHDLKRDPYLQALQPLRTLSQALRKSCGRLLSHLRDRYPEIYEEKANLVEARLEAELDQVRPEDLGKIDTFRREETSILEGAVQALLTDNWDQAAGWAKLRNETPSFWLQRDLPRRFVWSLIGAAAELGQQIQNMGCPLATFQTLQEALDFYTSAGFLVDRSHRQFEQMRLKLLEPTLPHFALIFEVAEKLRGVYRLWADQMNKDFARICQLDGFLPEENLQQRTLYEQVVHPRLQDGKKLAYFLIDAFRYEMATELLPQLEGAGATAILKGRYSELPSITAVGMNVLAPVSRAGRLMLAGEEGFKGFKTGEYTVRNPADRTRAMAERSVYQSGNKRSCSLKLAEVCDASPADLKKKCAEAQLIVVHSQEIDDAGEANVGLATFETWLQQIKAAWNHLRTAGVSEFVFTADHGFLLQDSTTEEKLYGSKRDPERRYVLMDEPRQEQNTVTVPLSTLQYDGQEGYLLFRTDTAVFATGKSGATFVHGGNSLQERVIPVLTLTQRSSNIPKLSTYLVEAKALAAVLGHSRLQVRLLPAPVAQSVLSFVNSSGITLGLRVPGRSDIRLSVKEAIGAELANQQVRLPVGGEWVELFFDLKGDRDERVQVEVFHPDGLEVVKPMLLPDYFAVSGQGQDKPPVAVVHVANQWQASIDDPAIRDVFLHLQTHGTLTESELIHMLGSPRSARRFTRDFDELVQKVPFSVRIETNSSGKRYVRQDR
jgi:PglZ domain